jgi:hypothetical protein
MIRASIVVRPAPRRPNAVCAIEYPVTVVLVALFNDPNRRCFFALPQ